MFKEFYTDDSYEGMMTTTKKNKTAKQKSKIVAYNKELVKATSNVSREASSAFVAVVKSSVFSKCKKSNLQRVLREYV